jgi:UDP-galactopyranose mutase
MNNTADSVDATATPVIASGSLISEPIPGGMSNQAAGTGVADHRPAPPLICLSHLRWGFVFQRPQHLMTRFAAERAVYFFEEPVHHDGAPHLHLDRSDPSGVVVATPHLPHGFDQNLVEPTVRELLDRMIADEGIEEFVLWYYTPMALGFSDHLQPLATIFDCMDELSMFKGAPPMLLDREKELFGRADLVFTGGESLYESKRTQHPHVFCFASSIDREHFGRARTTTTEPEDQKSIPHPRLGFFGVIDERMDIGLLAELARIRPDWHLVMIGPVVKIDPAELPQASNIHFLGGKSYAELPEYLAGWDIAILPFAMNDSTRFISPTKTPEYLAGGRPVISTPIRDVVRPYGEKSLVSIAATAEEFAAAGDEILAGEWNRSAWLSEVDTFLARSSWDMVWQQMSRQIDEVAEGRMKDRG